VIQTVDEDGYIPNQGKMMCPEHLSKDSPASLSGLSLDASKPAPHLAIFK
jgi:hypothetical protein